VRAAALSIVILLASGLARAEDFPSVPALEPNVAFWKRVYIEWSLNQVAFHDEEDLGLVYRVIPVPARGAKDAAGLTRAEAIKRGQAEVESALRSLARKNPKSADGLTGVEREVYLNIKDNPRADKYNRLAHVRVQNGLRERFVSGFGNSGLYDRFIREELKDNGLPEELIGIAFVESLFFVGAKSKVGAAGVWQFMTYTGKEYMQLNGVVDERWDPVLATEAACKYLKQAKKELGTWPLAITSYNYGRGGMRALAEAAGTKDFGVILAVSKNKRFGFAARNYYASFLAVLDILRHQDTLLRGVPKRASWTFDVVRAPFPLYASQLLATGDIDQASLDALNPALTNEASAGKVPLPHGISLRVPKGKGNAILSKLNALPERDKLRGLRGVRTVHRATGKQSIGEIAKKYGLPGDALAQATGLELASIPAKGQAVPIPHTNARYTLLPEARGLPLPPLAASQPILVADASALETADEDKPAKPAKPAVDKATVLASTVAGRGRVTVGPIFAEDLDELPAVAVLAGVGTSVLPMVDVVAGDLGADAPWADDAIAAAPAPPTS
jgi:membrane-bound lytic murein transglycosylase D